MTDIQKQTKLATKEQLRLAELLLQPGRNLLSTIDDAASQKRLKKVIELTNCTASVAEVALIDSEGSVEAAVALLLDKPDELVLWSHQGSKIRNRPSKALAGNTGTGSTTGQQKQQSKSAVMTSYGGSGRRGDSQRGENRFRRDVQNTSDGKQGLSGEGQQKKVFSNRSGEQQKNGYSNRAKSHERFGEKPFKPRGDRTTASGAANNGFRRRNNNPNASNNAFSKNENIAPNGTWNETKDWNANDNNCGQWNNNVAVEKEKDTNFGIGTFNDGEEAHPDEWKTGPKEYVQSTLQSANIINNSTTAQTPAVNTSSWPSLEHNNSTLTIGGTTGNATNIDIEQPPKPKTFASVAASKKAQQPPPQPPPQQMLVRKQFSDINALSDASGESSQTKQQQYNRQSFKQQTAETDSILLETKPVNGNCENTSVEQKWSTSVDWGVPPISPRLGNGQTAVISNQNTLPQHSESTSATVMAPADSFGPSAAHSMSVNQEYTNQLKSAIGLMQQPQNEHNNQQHSPQNNQQQLLISQNNNINQTKRMSTASSVEFFQQQISQMHDTLAADASDFDKKVEFATGDLPPPTVANIASSYQFGFQFDTKKWTSSGSIFKWWMANKTYFLC
ncbi:hypothetical protein Mgra_00004399 [Meloidogyne graminicola]|uniref:UBA domain-containing protein n=1 Tax=Meloidogyne graminicola TaxID=189291 RepID=A0A8S9ZRA6_9BILA|nr:hypothetical protein Mgra_00004399 [Meloidogyne graminicola]